MVLRTSGRVGSRRFTESLEIAISRGFFVPVRERGMEGLGRAFRYTASPWRKQPPVFFGMCIFLEDVRAAGVLCRSNLLLTGEN